LPVRLELGNEVRCRDGDYGGLADLVVDPTTKRVTHLVVKPRRADDVPRLVAIDLIDTEADAQPGIALRCALADTQELPTVQEYAYLKLGAFPVTDPNWDVGVETVLAMPYYESSTVFGAGDFGTDAGVVYDRIPKGEVEVRRASAVYAADGDFLGDVDGFVVDPDDHITHVVLERGHLWGRREVTIPIDAVETVETDKVTLRLSKDEVGALPSVHVHRWH
jgi:sporulation protein YlmC with PRC-barrel domain